MMQRLQITQAQQQFVADYHAANSVTPGEPIDLGEGVDIVVDDHLQVDHAWNAIALGPSVGSPGCLDTYVPDWGDVIIPFWKLEVYVTDRAGPNGEGMPVIDEGTP